MKRKTHVLFLFCLVGATLITCEDADDFNQGGEATSEDGVKMENGVFVLTGENFDTAITSHRVILVEFYAPWCGHCKSLAPKYEEAAKILKENDPPIALAKVDATVEESLAKRFEISGYPTLKFFKDGVAHDYEAPREVDHIVRQMKIVAKPDWAPPPPEVKTLTAVNFTDWINQQELSLVEFYAPWCGHCKRLAPEYEKAAIELRDNDPPIPLAKVDATADSQIATDYKVTGYPTLKVFRKGKEFEYKGDKDTSTAIVNYMRKQVGDGSKEKTCAELKKLLNKDDVTVAAFFKSTNDVAYQTYQSAASDVREEYDFYHSFDNVCRTDFKANWHNVIMLYPEIFYSGYEPRRQLIEVTDKTTMSDIVDFFHKSDVTLVGEFHPVSSVKRYKNRRPLVLVFYMVDFTPQYRKATQLWREKILDIANEYEDFTFAIADEDKNREMWKSFGFEDSGEEMNIGILADKDVKYPMEPMEEFSSEEIKDFLAKYKRDKVKPYLKSQPIPKKSSGPVTVVVGKTFDNIVNNPDKDVLIEFYAPWCGHCKQLEPTYKELAKKYKDEKNLVIAKLDATANDVIPPYQVQGFPTIYFSPAGRKTTPLKYEESGRDVPDFVNFLEQHARNSLGKSLKDEL